LGGLLIIATGCTTNKALNASADTPISPTIEEVAFLNQSNDLVVKKTTQNLMNAKIKAAQWKNDTYFAGYNCKLANNLKTDGMTENYVFGSIKEPYYWWVLTINEQGKTSRALIPKEDYLGTKILPIQESYWKISSQEALKIAEKNGGKTFRAKNQNIKISLLLNQAQPKNWLWWQVEYKSDNEKLTIRINPANGLVYNEDGNLKDRSGSSAASSPSVK